MERNVKFFLGIGLFAVIVIGIGIYAYLQSREFLRGPQITITSPADGSVFFEPPVSIVGTAQNISVITLNGAPIFTDSEGRFGQKLLLLPGYNILTISAQDRFGKKVEKTLQLVYKVSEAVQMASTTSPSVISAKAGIQSGINNN